MDSIPTSIKASIINILYLAPVETNEHGRRCARQDFPRISPLFLFPLGTASAFRCWPTASTLHAVLVDGNLSSLLPTSSSSVSPPPSPFNLSPLTIGLGLFTCSLHYHRASARLLRSSRLIYIWLTRRCRRRRLSPGFTSPTKLSQVSPTFAADLLATLGTLSRHFHCFNRLPLIRSFRSFTFQRPGSEEREKERERERARKRDFGIRREKRGQWRLSPPTMSRRETRSRTTMASMSSAWMWMSPLPKVI